MAGIALTALLPAWSIANAQEAEGAPRVVALTEIKTDRQEGVHNVRPTSDGGYLLLGTGQADDGSRDMAMWKLDASLRPDPRFGNAGRVQLGSSGDDQAVDAVERLAADGTSRGFLVVGQVGAGDRDFTGRGHAGKVDLAFVGIDPKGALSGEDAIRLLGGSDDDEFIVHHDNYSEPGARLLTVPDGYIVVGQTRSADGAFPAQGTIGVADNRDALLLKIDREGRLDRAYGNGGTVRLGTTALADPGERTPTDFLFSVAPAADGGVVASGYVLGRYLELPGGNVQTKGNLERDASKPCEGDINCYLMDGLLVKVDAAGRLDPAWGDRGVRFVGGSYQEKQYDVIRDHAGRYLFVGRTSSFDLDLERPREVREFDGYIGRVLADGSLDPGFGRNGMVALGGNDDDKALRVVEYRPGAYAVALEAGSLEIELAPGLTARGAKGDVLVLFLDDRGTITDYLQLGTAALDRPTGMALTPSGQIVLAGLSLTKSDGKGNEGEAGHDVFVALIDPPHASAKAGQGAQ